jgi:hypothetical protein
VKKEQCPQCGKLGKDKHGDNLAIYSDGHSFCYSCAYYRSASGLEHLKTKGQENYLQEPPYLPIDCDILYPKRAIEWIEQYELTTTDCLNHNVMWSESLQRLIFPVYGDGQLIAWQGRAFHLPQVKNPKIPKWYGKGNLKDTFNILGKGNKIVLCEDIVSAIKLSNCGIMAMPLYGSFIGIERFRRLIKLIPKDTKVGVWLDPDKRPEAASAARLGRLCGLQCRSIISDKDPKEHSYDEIRNIINPIQDTIYKVLT